MIRNAGWPRVFGALLLTALLAGTAHAAGPIVSGETKSGTIAGPSYEEVWTFTGVAGQRIQVGALTTSGTLNTNVVIEPPGGGAAVVNTSADFVDYQLLATGTYTLRIQDVGFDTPGTYALSFMNLNAGPFTTAGDLDGGPIASGEIKTGTIGVPADFDAFTFSGKLGDRVLISGVATSGTLNTTFYLYPPNGGPAEAATGADQIDVQLAQTGTYTILMVDNGIDNTGAYSISLINLTSGPLTTVADPDGGYIISGESKAAHMDAVGDFDAFRFVGGYGQHVLVGAVTTGGGMNTNIAVYPPGGGAAIIFTSADYVDFQLPSSGTYSIVIEDVGQDQPGDYVVSYMNATAGPYTTDTDPDAGPLVSSKSRNGTISGTADFDMFTFTASAGDRILIAGLTTGGSLNTTMYVFPPSGGAAEVATTADRVDFQAAETGTYSLLMADNGLDDTGTYTVSLLNLTAGPLFDGVDPDGGTILSAEVKTGQMNGIGDFDAYRFTANLGDRVLIDALATSGTLNTQVAIYPPGGGAATVYTSADRIDYQATATGTYTIEIEDVGLDSPGAYTLAYMNVTSGPYTTAGDTNAGPIVSAGSVTGQIGSIADMDVYTFTGTMGDRVLLSCLPTSGALNTVTSIYPPGGGAAEVVTTADRIDTQLLATGTYTVVVEDAGDDNTGGYQLALLNMTAGPLTSVSDPDGGTLTSGEVKTGQMNGIGDFDVFKFTGSQGQRVLIGGITTAGSLNTQIVVYPPVGPSIVYTSADRVDFQLPVTGTYTIEMEDVSLANTGSYALGYVNLSAGPYTNPGDLDGGAIASTEIKTGQMNGPVDFDIYTFNAIAGDRVIIAGVTTAGAMNTTFYLYPPGGGAAEIATGSDRLDTQLLKSGTYVLEMEDAGLDNTGSYALSYANVSSGPWTSALDPNGGPLARNQLVAGAISAVPDVDVWSFMGSIGDTAVINCVTTSGTLNTQVAIYPPGGGAATVYTSADAFNYVLPASGYWSIEVEDVGLDETGTYSLRVQGTGGVTGAGDPPLPARVEFAGAAPNPFAGTTAVAFALPAGARVQLRIFDVRGALVRTLADDTFAAGPHRVPWNGRDDGGALAASGVYYAELVTGRDALRKRLVLVR